MIEVFQIQIKSKNYIAKYNANTKTKSCVNKIFCRIYHTPSAI